MYVASGFEIKINNNFTLGLWVGCGLWYGCGCDCGMEVETIPTDEVMHGDIDVEVEIDKTMSDKGKISPVIFFSDYDLLLDIANLP